MASPWLIARQVREAIRSDRPDEAHRLLEPLLAAGHRKAWRLAREVAAAHIRRAEKFLRHDNPDAAWTELLAAEGLNTGEESAATLRQTLTKYGFAVVRAALEAGKPLVAIDVAERLRQRGVRHPDLAPLLEAAQDWILTADIASRGDFLLANTHIERIRTRLTCPQTGLDRFEADVRDRHERFRHAVGELHTAVEAGRSREAILWADEVLAAAPTHRQARLLRRSAWDRLHPESVFDENRGLEAAEEAITEGVRTEPAPQRSAIVSVGNGPSRPHASTATHPPSHVNDDPPLRRLASDGDSRGEIVLPPISSSLPKRFVLWVNNAGGYLVCLSPRIMFGQGLADGPVDVPLLADVSRLHAELTRDPEGYVLESQRDITVNGRPATRAPLKPNDRVTLGSGCQFIFHQPSPMSTTARLEFISGHHFPLAVHGVILMAENLILGPDETSHVCLSGLKSPVVLYRSGNALGVSAPGTFRVENEPFQDRAVLPLPGWVHGEGFGFGLEPIAGR